MNGPGLRPSARWLHAAGAAHGFFTGDNYPRARRPRAAVGRRGYSPSPCSPTLPLARLPPTAATFARLLFAAGWELAAQPHVSFTEQPSPRGKPTWVPDRLPRLDAEHALAAVELPPHLNWRRT
jgi:hypothetical protein